MITTIKEPESGTTASSRLRKSPFVIHLSRRLVAPKRSEGGSIAKAGLSSFAFALLLILLSACGCQTSTQSLFTATGPNWHVQQGQALWRPKSGLPEFGGDLVYASDDAGRHLIQFDKTPMTIMSAQTTSNRWLIKFPQKNMSFSGHGTGSTRFGWLYLPLALDGKPLPKDFKFERKPDGGWRLENSHTGELLEGFLSP